MAKNAEKVEEAQSEIGVLEAEMAALELQQQVQYDVYGSGHGSQAVGRA